MRIIRFILLASFILACSPLYAGAQEKMMDKKVEVPGAVASYLKQSKHVEASMVSLAEAIPAEKYTWRPTPEVRSIAESFLHAAAGNYITMSTVGIKLPDGVDWQKMEKSSTDKATVIATLKKSFTDSNDGFSKIPHSDFDRHVSFFGNDMTVLDMIFGACAHQHELLGQQITYARMAGVVPPWTAAMQAKNKEKEGMKKN